MFHWKCWLGNRLVVSRIKIPLTVVMGITVWRCLKFWYKLKWIKCFHLHMYPRCWSLFYDFAFDFLFPWVYSFILGLKWSLFLLYRNRKKNIFKTSPPRVPTNPFARKCVLICEKLVGTRVCLSNYNLDSFLIHQACYSKGYQWHLMQREVFGSIWKIGRYLIKVSEVLPHSSTGLVHFRFKGWWMVFLIFIQILIEHSVSQQWRPWSDATFCGVWSGFALFAYVPQKGR